MTVPRQREEAMETLGKILQTVVAGGGFFAGYLWSVLRWAGEGDRRAALLVQASLSAGALLAGLYMILLAGLFWAWLPNPRAAGLRMAVSPVAFTLSFLTGALGLQGALHLLGG